VISALAQGSEPIFELLPYLIAVLIGVVGGLGRLVSWLLERRVRKMREYEESGGGTMRPSVPRGGVDDGADRPVGEASGDVRPKRTILDDIRRYMEMMEDRTLGDPADQPGRRGEKRRPVGRRDPTPESAEDGRSSSKGGDASPPATRTPSPASAPAPAPSAEREFPTARPGPRGSSPFRPRVPYGEGARTPTGAPVTSLPPVAPGRPIVAVPAEEVGEELFGDFWTSTPTAKRRKWSVGPADRRRLREAVVWSEILGAPMALREPGREPGNERVV